MRFAMFCRLSPNTGATGSPWITSIKTWNCQGVWKVNATGAAGSPAHDGILLDTSQIRPALKGRNLSSLAL